MIDDALAYAERHVLHALVATRDGETVAERYGGGYDAQRPHALYSGTKSFWGVTAVIAEREGMLRLDEPVAATIPDYARDERTSAVTLRMLLDLTAGYGFGGLGASVPAYDAALAMPLRNDPGTRFTYGGIALQVFGAVLARKLAPLGTDPVGYLRARVLEPAGVAIASWRTLRDGTHPLPTGAFLTARNWLAYGTWVFEHRDALRAALQPSPANARYALGWWLAPPGSPPDLFYASGAAGQALYIAPSERLVLVHFGKSASYKHEAFLRKLFA